VEAVEGKSVRESEKLLFAHFPEHENVKPTTVKQVAAQTKRLEINLSEELFAKLEMIKALRSSVNPYGEWAVFLDDLAELALDKWHPARQKERREKRILASELKKQNELIN
jgi:hypothetical protein